MATKVSHKVIFCPLQSSEDDVSSLRLNSGWRGGPLPDCPPRCRDHRPFSCLRPSCSCYCSRDLLLPMTAAATAAAAAMFSWF